MPALAPSDVVVYDRGYFCFRLLHTHLDRGLHAVFRLKSNANSVCEQFRRSGRRDGIVTIEPSDTAREQQPEAVWRPCRVRLLRYTVLYPTLFRVTDPRLFLQECAASPT